MSEFQQDGRSVGVHAVNSGNEQGRRPDPRKDEAWPELWGPVDDEDAKSTLEKELKLELKPGHRLFGVVVALLGRHVRTDDALFHLLDGTGRVAEVHLTWAGDREKPPWPSTKIFNNFDAWVLVVRRKACS